MCAKQVVLCGSTAQEMLFSWFFLIHHRIWGKDWKIRGPFILPQDVNSWWCCFCYKYYYCCHYYNWLLIQNKDLIALHARSLFLRRPRSSCIILYIIMLSSGTFSRYECSVLLGSVSVRIITKWNTGYPCLSWLMPFFLTGKDVEDLHQIGTHHFLNRELLYRLQQGKENYISSHRFLN